MFVDGKSAERDAGGATVWSTPFGTAKNEVAHGVAELSDGRFVAVGSTDASAAGEGLAVLLDAAGNVGGSKTYGGTGADELRAVVTTGDGLAMAGSYGGGSTGTDAWLVVVDLTLGVVFEQRFGGAKNDNARAIALRPGGGYLLAGMTASKGSGKEDAWLIATDPNGNLVWDTVYGGAESDSCTALTVTSLDGMSLAGTKGVEPTRSEPWLLGTDAWGYTSCASGRCATIGPETCADADPCTIDGCNPTLGCTHSQSPDGARCGVGLVCLGGVCL